MGLAQILPQILEDELLAITAISKGIIQVSATSAIPRFDTLTGTIHMAEGCRLALDSFMNVCRLLAAHSKQPQLKVNYEPLLTDAHICV
jgi:hypothetical protein